MFTIKRLMSNRRLGQKFLIIGAMMAAKQRHDVNAVLREGEHRDVELLGQELDRRLVGLLVVILQAQHQRHRRKAAAEAYARLLSHALATAAAVTSFAQTAAPAAEPAAAE